VPDVSGVPGFAPAWPLPDRVRAWQTTRGIGVPPYGGFNLGVHVGDDPNAVQANRAHLTSAILPTAPVWLTQVHGTRVLTLTGHEPPLTAPEADAVLTNVPGQVCVIMTADCLPVLIADRYGRVVGAAHAGWRGLADGVLEALVQAMTALGQVQAQDLLVWLGPVIGPTAFEVGDDVRDTFLAQSSAYASSFEPHVSTAGKWLADLPSLAQQKLAALGVIAVTDSGVCTYTSADFYSYRRENVTGRMGSMIWIAP
jgi:YfiH family protein